MLCLVSYIFFSCSRTLAAVGSKASGSNPFFALAAGDPRPVQLKPTRVVSWMVSQSEGQSQICVVDIQESKDIQ